MKKRDPKKRDDVMLQTNIPEPLGCGSDVMLKCFRGTREYFSIFYEIIMLLRLVTQSHKGVVSMMMIHSVVARALWSSMVLCSAPQSSVVLLGEF